MTRIVLDVLFCETIHFSLLAADFAACNCAFSREEILRKAMERVGIELIDYGNWTQALTQEGRIRISACSKAYRERAERATASR